jgi:serine/threonine-protein kinase RsbW
MMGAMADHTLRIAADVHNLADIRRFVREAAAEMGAGPDAICGLELAIEEAACNAIVHGYQGRTGWLEVEVQRDEDAAVVRLRDGAPPFDPTHVLAPDLTLPLEERPLGGLGVYLIRQSVDEMVHRVTPDGGNELTLRKRLRKEGDNGDQNV